MINERKYVKHLDEMTYEELVNQKPSSAIDSEPKPLTEANLSAMNKSRDQWTNSDCNCKDGKKQVNDLDMKRVEMVKAADRLLSMGWS